MGERERKEMLDRVEKEVLDIVSGRLVDPTTKRVYTPGMISKALDQLTSQQHQHEEEKKNSSSSEETRNKKLPTWSGFTSNKSAKSQALDAMKALIAWQPIPVMRARMRLRITCPVSLLKQAVKTGGPSSADEKEKNGDGKEKKGGGGKKAKGKKQQQDDAESSVPTKTTTTLKDKVLGYIESIETQEVVGGDDEWDVVGFVQPGAFRMLNELVAGETRGRGRVEVLDMAVTQED